MMTPIGFKNRISFGIGSGSHHKYTDNPTVSCEANDCLSMKFGEDDASKAVLLDCLNASEEQDIFIPSHGPAGELVNSLVEQGYDYTAACDVGDRFARCLKSHENV